MNSQSIIATVGIIAALHGTASAQNNAPNPSKPLREVPLAKWNTPTPLPTKIPTIEELRAKRLEKWGTPTPVPQQTIEGKIDDITMYNSPRLQMVDDSAHFSGQGGWDYSTGKFNLQGNFKKTTPVLNYIPTIALIVNGRCVMKEYANNGEYANDKMRLRRMIGGTAAFVGKTQDTPCFVYDSWTPQKKPSKK